jgi:rod shape-determining protein MreD
MRDAFRAALGIGLAFGLYTILGRLASSWLPMISLFTLTVVYFGQRQGELSGAITGTVSGLLLDAFSLGVFGISGLTLTVVGYLAGLISKKVQLASFVKTFAFVAGITLVESLLWLGLVRLILSQKTGRLEDILVLRPLVTAAVGAIVFGLIRRREVRHGQ